LQREQEPKSAYVFINERGQPFGRMGIARMIEASRWGGEAAIPGGCSHDTAPVMFWHRGAWTREDYNTICPRLNHQHGEVFPRCRRSRLEIFGGRVEPVERERQAMVI
jgi:hypothetical protein